MSLFLLKKNLLCTRHRFFFAIKSININPSAITQRNGFLVLVKSNFEKIITFNFFSCFQLFNKIKFCLVPEQKENFEYNLKNNVSLLFFTFYFIFPFQTRNGNLFLCVDMEDITVPANDLHFTYCTC